MGERVFEVEGMKGRYVVAGFGYPPIDSIAFASEVEGWTKQTGFGGERAWVSLRQVEGPAEGLLFNVNSRRKSITLVASEEVSR